MASTEIITTRKRAECTRHTGFCPLVSGRCWSANSQIFFQILLKTKSLWRKRFLADMGLVEFELRGRTSVPPWKTEQVTEQNANTTDSQCGLRRTRMHASALSAPHSQSPTTWRSDRAHSRHDAFWLEFPSYPTHGWLMLKNTTWFLYPHSSATARQLRIPSYES